MSVRGRQIRERIKSLALTPDETWEVFCHLTGAAPDQLIGALDTLEEDRARRAVDQTKPHTAPNPPEVGRG